MPIISRFYGIVIAMYFMDHAPPHIHAKYADGEAIYSFDGKRLQGKIASRADRLVREWIAMHTKELEVNWRNAQSGSPLSQIEPLE